MVCKILPRKCLCGAKHHDLQFVPVPNLIFSVESVDVRVGVYLSYMR